MEDKVNFAAVGAFVIVLLVAMIGGGLWLASGTYQRKAYDRYETYMTESVAGLNVNAAVRYRGVDVGRVRQIMLAPGNVEQVRLRLDIERGTPVKVDTVATLQTQGLTGIAFVELSGGQKDSPALQAAPGQELPVITSGPSLIARLETAAPVVIASLARLGENLNAVLDDSNRQALRSTLADLAVLTKTLAGRASTIDAALASTARTMDHAARASGQLPALVQRFEQAAVALERMAGDVSAASASARGTLASANDAIDSAKGALASARGTLDASRADLAQFTGSTLPEARELVVELRGLTATLQRVADEVERHPGVLLQGRASARRGPGE